MARFFERRALLDICAKFMADSSPYMIVKGTAGQGKTALIQQFLKQNKYKSINYTCSDLDSSEIIFLSEITASIITQLLGENINQYLTVHSACKTSKDYLHTLDQVVRHSLQAKQSKLIVIDDIHKVVQDNTSYVFLQQLLEIIRPLGKIFIIGRECRTNFYSTLPKGTKSINQENLNLSVEETLNFHTQFLKKNISTQQLNSIYNATKGWISGLLLLQHSTEPTVTALNHSSESLCKYFNQLCLKDVKPAELEEVLPLSFLEMIPIELLRSPEFSNAHNLLSRLDEKNLFINSKISGYKIHYLFRTALQKTAYKHLTHLRLIEKIQLISSILLQHDLHIVAITLLDSFSLWNNLEELIENNSDALIIETNSIHLKQVLLGCPKKELKSHPWLQLAYGTCAITTGDISGLVQINAAHKIFKKLKHEKGLLYSCISLIRTYYSTTYNMRELKKLAIEGNNLMHKLHDKLNPETLTHIIQSIATALSYCAINCERNYNLLSLLPEEPAHPSNEKIYSNALFLHSYYLFRGFVIKGLKAFAPTYLIQTFPNTTQAQGLFLQVLAMNSFLMIGDHKSYCRIRDYTQKSSSSAISLDGKDFIAVWNQDVLLGKNSIEDILKDPHENISNKHIIAQLLQFKFVAYALEGNKKKAREYEKKALRMRARVSGKYFIIHMHSFLAVSRALVGDYKAAQRLITVGLERATKRDLFMMINTFYFAQAIIHLRQNNTVELKKTLGQLFHSMIRLNNPYFFGRHGETFIELCCHAIKHNIFRQYAKDIARTQFFISITDDGKTYDILNFHTIGALKLRSNKIELDESSFTPLQIDILRALLATPKNMLSVEALIESIWPDSHRDTARTKFDVTISRLRSLLSKHFGKSTGKEYLKVKNGTLLLQHATESFSRISVMLKKGLTYLNNEEYWSADQAFWEAIEEIPEHKKISQYFSVAEETLFLTAVTKWATLMERALLHDHIEVVLKKALIMCPYSDRLYGILWRNLIDTHKYAEATRIRQQYREVLQENNIPSNAIKENEHHIFSTG